MGSKGRKNGTKKLGLSIWDRRAEGRGFYFRISVKVHGRPTQIRMFLAHGDAPIADVKKGAQKLLGRLASGDLTGADLQAMARNGGELPSDKAHTLGDAIDAWGTHSELKGNSGTRYEMNKLALWGALLGEGTELMAISGEDVRRAARGILEGRRLEPWDDGTEAGLELVDGPPRTRRTLDTYTSQLRGALNLAADDGFTHRIGRKTLETIKPDRRRVRMDYRFFRALLELATIEDPELELFLRLAQDCGARNIEFRSVHWVDCSFVKAGLRVQFDRLPRSNKINHRILVFTRKETIEAFKRWELACPSRDGVFHYPYGSEGKAVRRLRERVAKQRRVPRARVAERFRGVQDLRHEFIQSLHLDREYSVKESMAIVGHRTPEIHIGYGGPDLTKGHRPAVAVHVLES